VSYDCLVPFSGGVESTALVYHLKNNNFNPFVFHVGYNPGEQDNHKKREELLDIRIHTVVYNFKPDLGFVIEKDKTVNFYKQEFDPNGFPPFQPYWAMVAFTYFINSPHINKIYFGLNKDESRHQLGEHLYEGMKKSAKEINVDLIIEPPLGHLSKLEQYQSLSDDLKKTIMSCVTGGNAHCGRCNKCRELKRVTDADNTSNYLF
jgi:7-cyano-7-deazaguanine synthase in queuosine biosynthesis